MEYSTAKLLFFFLFIKIISSLHVQAFNDHIFSSKPHISTIDPYDVLHIIPNPDGSITRIKEFYPTVPPNTTSSLAFSRDVSLNPDKNTSVRVYLPNKRELDNLPIIIFAHGGEFIVKSIADPKVDSFCANMASQLNVLVVSVDYRLAPEHRLPAAYDDVLEALYWVKSQKDEWVRKYGDVSRCVLMGESSGGNMIYNVALKASVIVHELNPLVIKGLVLIQPFFGWVNQTGSEYRDITGSLNKLDVILWNLSLPTGANWNKNPYFDPMFKGGSSNLENIKELGWPVIIAGCDGDFLFEKQVVVFKFLEKVGLDVKYYFSEGYYHDVFVNDTTQALKIFEFVQSLFSSYMAY